MNTSLIPLFTSHKGTTLFAVTNNPEQYVLVGTESKEDILACLKMDFKDPNPFIVHNAHVIYTLVEKGEQLFEKEIQTLLKTKGVFVDADMEELFYDVCLLHDIHPSGGILMLPQSPNNPIPGKFAKCFYTE